MNERKAIEDSARATYADDSKDRAPPPPPRDHIRIISTLEWFFNYAGGDMGMRSNFTEGGGSHMSGQAAADAVEARMADTLEDAGKFRAIAAVYSRLTRRDQYEIKHAFTARRWPLELNRRPVQQRWLACNSKPVRAFLEAHGRKQWTLRQGEQVLASAEQSKLTGAALIELVTTKRDAWSEAERMLNGLLTRYNDAHWETLREKEVEQNRRRARLLKRAS